jgi:hypothetical protein
MFRHLSHSHLEFRLLLVGLGLAIAIVIFYLFVGWREGKRMQAPKFTVELPRRLQSAKRRSKKRHPAREIRP